MSLFSSTASLRSSILRSIEENGRKYHGYKDGKYLLPDDEVIISITDLSISGPAVSLTLSSKNSTGKVRSSYFCTWITLTCLTVFQYDLCLLTFDHTLSFAPFTKLNRVLDVGCGVGECGRTSCMWHFVAANIISRLLGIRLRLVLKYNPQSALC